MHAFDAPVAAQTFWERPLPQGALGGSHHEGAGTNSWGGRGSELWRDEVVCMCVCVCA